MYKQNSNDEESGNKAPRCAEICFVILYLVNIVTATIGIVRDADGFWGTLFHCVLCIIYFLLAIVPTIAVTWIMAIILSFLLNDSLKEFSLTFHIGKGAFSISLYDILCSTTILALLYFPLHSFIGLSVFNVYDILRITGYI